MKNVTKILLTLLVAAIYVVVLLLILGETSSMLLLAFGAMGISAITIVIVNSIWARKKQGATPVYKRREK